MNTVRDCRSKPKKLVHQDISFDMSEAKRFYGLLKYIKEPFESKKIHNEKINK